jgi:pyruvate dehydrogenase E1 component
MIPFYIFYSMFGFQRTGDQIWQAADARARGFLLGGTAGRTTLNGEGLQHADGHSLLLASTVPCIEAYDVAYAYELAAIVEDGLRRMLTEDEDVIFYISLQNENYPMPGMPEGAKQELLRGLYKLRPAAAPAKHRVQLFGSGSILNEVLRAQTLLAERFEVAADVWSVTSYQKLRADALACERYNRLNPREQRKTPYLSSALADVSGPFIAASDWMKTVPDQVARWIPGRFVPLGTDGFGLSDTREALRRHFEVDAENIALAALDALCSEGKLDPSEVERAIEELDVDPDKLDAVTI